MKDPTLASSGRRGALSFPYPYPPFRGSRVSESVRRGPGSGAYCREEHGRNASRARLECPPPFVIISRALVQLTETNWVLRNFHYPCYKFFCEMSTGVSEVIHLDRYHVMTYARNPDI